MLDYLDNLLRHLFLSRIDEITDEAQVRFQPPDDDWKNYLSTLSVGGQPVNAINVHLADVRENRVYRSNDRTRDLQQGVISETPAPRRVDCHYLITAWSPAKVTPSIEPTVDEHALIYKVIGALMNAEPLVPRNVYSPNPLPANFPALIADTELPTQILPVEGFAKLAEFWNDMGNVHSWRPMVYFIVTLPVVLATQVTGPMVTTRITEYRQSGKPGTIETWIQIGGTVLAAGQPVTNAWVQIQDALFHPLGTVTTSTDGRFTFGGLVAGTYNLRVRAQGFNEAHPGIQVPSPTGSYDIQLT
ncbi:MAG TPA: Pvc16 family protein [Verrucomicrobiae bacterium]|nr:Pvc16 family protein [Verrucomicrobiae bacterium]